MLDGTGSSWAVSSVGDDLTRTPVIGPALAAGGHLHVGLEFYRGDRTPTNATLVGEAADCARSAGPSRRAPTPPSCSDSPVAERQTPAASAAAR
jgi:uncharacterized protein (DUF849 family)